MAQGTVTVFNEAKKNILNGTIKIGSDTFKLLLVSDTSITAAQLTPDSSDFTEVTPIGTEYTTGGEALTLAVNTSSGGTGAQVDITTDIALAKDTGGPTNIRYGIVYSTTAVSSDAIGFVDIGNGANVSLQDGSLNITWGTNGMFEID